MGKFSVNEQFPDISDFTSVDYNQYRISKTEKLGSKAIDHGLAFTLYSRDTHYMGFAHILDYKGKLGVENSEQLMRRMVDEMLAINHQASLEATLSGEREPHKNNSASQRAEEILRALGIPVIGKDLGLNFPRVVFALPETGEVQVYRLKIPKTEFPPIVRFHHPFILS